MTEAASALRRTLRRLDELVEEHGLDPGDVVDVAEITYRTGISGRRIRFLLKGGAASWDDDVDARVRGRVLHLYQTRTERRPGDVAAVAGKLGVGTVRAQQLLEGRKTPNIVHGQALTEHFGVDNDFLVAPATQLLNRSLLPVVERLSRQVPDPMAQLMERLGVTSVSFRGNELTMPQRAAVAQMLEAMLKSNTREDDA
ncbi:hypothetical protein ACFXG1_15540 [Streptomyces sp. NPDC059248]|uniref:hypothetical protein n=2 Tax=unclassified Streptomyces TaxID=2593676 RepID=UPI00369DDE9D